MSCVQNIIKIASTAVLISSVTMIGGGLILNKTEKWDTKCDESYVLCKDDTPIYKKVLYQTKKLMRDAGDPASVSMFVWGVIGFAGLSGLSILNGYKMLEKLSKLPEEDIKKLDDFF